MLNPHQFQQHAKEFRAGRITLAEFTDRVFCDGAPGTTQRPVEKKKPLKTNVASAETPCAPAHLPQRPAASHKGDFGRVLVIGGSKGMSGAVGMTGLAALRSGAGLVKVAVPEAIQNEVAAISPCLMTLSCRDGERINQAADLIQETNWADVVALGPGMGRGNEQEQLVGTLYRKVEKPIVVDADALNALADAGVELSEHAGDRVLTPHPGEFRRLAISSDLTLATDRCDWERTAKQMASSANVVIVLKGAQTFVTDGTRDYRNDTGNPGMATAGSGDVLTGVITALLGQGMSAFDASTLGVQIHGAAGDSAAESYGEVSMIATDLIDNLAGAFKRNAAQRGGPIGF